MAIVLTLLIIIFAVVVSLLLMPVKISGEARGGTDSGIHFTGDIRPWWGFAGMGVGFSDGRYRARILLLSWTIVDVDVTRFAARKKPEKKTESAKAVAVDTAGGETKESGIDKLKKGIEKLKEFHGYFREATHIIRDIVRFDFVTADVTLGLGNPAMTGMITGILFAVNDLMPREYTIKPSFDFTREVFDGDVWAEMTVFPAMIWKHLFTHAAEIIRFARSRRTRDAEILTQEV